MWDEFRRLDRWLGRLPQATQLASAFVIVVFITTPLFALSASFDVALAHAVVLAALSVAATRVGRRIAQRRHRER